jgi:hypothetical protein
MLKNAMMLEWIQENGFDVRENDKILGGTAYYKRILSNSSDNPIWLCINNPIRNKKDRDSSHCWDAWLMVLRDKHIGNYYNDKIPIPENRSEIIVITIKLNLDYKEDLHLLETGLVKRWMSIT